MEWEVGPHLLVRVNQRLLQLLYRAHAEEFHTYGLGRILPIEFKHSLSQFYNGDRVTHFKYEGLQIIEPAVLVTLQHSSCLRDELHGLLYEHEIPGHLRMRDDQWLAAQFISISSNDSTISRYRKQNRSEIDHRSKGFSGAPAG
jgi:hypothetical protein